MAWKDNLLDASFRGVTFDVLRTRDRGERALVEHEYPYRPGAEVEDMGRKARRISMTAVFYGQEYEAGLAALLEALEKPGKAELIHPVFGSVTVCAGPYDIPHEGEQPDYVEVSLEFVEAAPDNPFLGASGRNGKAQDAGLRADGALDDAKGGMGRAFADWLRTQSKDWNLAEKAGVFGKLSETLDAYDDVQNAGRSALSYIDFPHAYLADLEAAVGIASGNFMPVSGFGNWTRLGSLFSGLDIGGGSRRSYPAGTAHYADASLAGPASGLPEPSPVIGGSTAPRPATPPRTPELTTAEGASTAMSATLANITQTTLMGHEATTLLEAEVATPTMTPHEVEAVVGNMRDRMQDCMDDARAVLPPEEAHPVVEALRDASLALQELGAVVLAARPPLMRYVVPWPCNLHLLAHRLYGDHARAVELSRLNPSIRNPNFLAAGQELLVHAR